MSVRMLGPMGTEDVRIVLRGGTEVDLFGKIVVPERHSVSSAAHKEDVPSQLEAHQKPKRTRRRNVRIDGSECELVYELGVKERRDRGNHCCLSEI
jgi:hypothetical protein